jgi:hypothetical protein
MEIKKPTCLPHVKYQRQPTFFEWGEWNTPARHSSKIEVKYIDRFDARGMRHLYGRGDHYGRGRTFNMDVWLTQDGRMLARFWSRSSMVDLVSIEVSGLSPKPPLLKPGNRVTEPNERWVPWCLRNEYSGWIEEQSDSNDWL